MNRKSIVTIGALLVLVTMLIVAPTSAQEDHPLKGQTIDMAIIGIGGWLPSSLGVSMAQELFAPYAMENYGYTVTLPSRTLHFLLCNRKQRQPWQADAGI